MNTLHTVEAVSIGGRDGHVKSASGFIDLDLRTPREMGGAGGATNPEELFAAGLAACFNAAIKQAAKRNNTDTGEITVNVKVSLMDNSKGGFIFSAVINANISGVSEEVAYKLAAEAHTICPYSNSVRGNVQIVNNISNK